MFKLVQLKRESFPGLHCIFSKLILFLVLDEIASHLYVLVTRK